MLEQRQPSTPLQGPISHLVFFVMAMLAFVFYRERVLFYDSAFVSFELIKDHALQIPHARWSAVLPQTLTYWASQKHLTLETLLQLYSVSHVVFHYVFFLIVFYLIKDYQAAWLILLCQCLTFRLTYYFTMVELYQGLTFAVFSLAIFRLLLRAHSSRVKTAAVMLPLIVALSFFHPITIIPFLFLMGGEYLIRRDWMNKQFISIFITTCMWFIIRMTVFNLSAYESEKLVSFSDFMRELPHFFQLPSTRYLIGFTIHQLLVPFGAFLIGLLFVVRKNPTFAFFSGLSAVGFFVIVCILHYRGESPVMYENYFTIFGLFIGFTLLYVMEVFNFRRFATFCFVVLIGYSLNGIANIGKQQAERTSRMQHMVDYGRQFSNRKFILRSDNFKELFMWGSWAMPFETIMLSSLNSPDQGVSIYYESRDSSFSAEEMKTENVFLGPEWSPFWFKSNALNERYFKLPSAGYISWSTYQDDSSSFHESDISKDSMLIQPLLSTYTITAKCSEIEVELTNLSSHILPSIPRGTTQIFLSYHLADSAGKNIQWDNYRTKLDVDLYPGKSYVQRMKLDLPPLKGSYQIQFDLVTEGKRWWNIGTSSALLYQ